MAGERKETLGGGTKSRPLNDTVAETGPGIPDDAVGPEQRSIPDLLSLGEGPEAQAFARKLDGRADESDEDSAP